MLLLVSIMDSGSISCDVQTGGTNENTVVGDKLVVECYLNKQLTTAICKHGYCAARQLAIIKSRIKKKFGSSRLLLTVKLANGTFVSLTSMFCSYGTGKKNKTLHKSLNSKNIHLKICEDRENLQALIETTVCSFVFLNFSCIVELLI